MQVPTITGDLTQEATLANGLLEIRRPASPQLMGKRIPIQVGGEEKKQLKAA